MSKHRRAFGRPCPEVLSVIGFIVLVTLPLGCGDEDRQKPDGEDSAADVFVPTDIIFPDIGDTATPDTADATPDADICVGCTGYPCETNDECNSGFCLPGPTGRECAQSCVSECTQDGYVCREIALPGSDVAFVCVYGHLAYCAPCDLASDCSDPLNPGANTICRSAGDGSGSFCATSCTIASDCPDGARCIENHCIPVTGEVCDCSWWAIDRGASTTCSTSNALGTCEAERACEPGGLAACGAPTPTSEKCNAVDDDCDGSTDEDFPSLGEPCDRDDDDDLCKRGHWACGATGGLACEGDDAVTAEVCNGQDDDCDGQTDETFPNDGGPCDSSDDADDCQDDVLRCVGNQVVCVDSETLRQEICNGVDDDCDGQTDADDPELVHEICEGVHGVCAGAVKPASLCQAGAWLPCDDATYAAQGFEKGNEVSCDGKDNDCDGATDEDFSLVLRDDTTVTGIGASCGSGACAGAVTACNAAGTGIVCPGQGGEAPPELCNGIDDDCNALTDQFDPALVDAACEKQAGVCDGATHPSSDCLGELGWSPCSDSVYATYSADYQPAAELSCDGLDNECDGKTDDDFLLVTPDGATVIGVGKSCGVGVCAGGFTVCGADDASITCSTSGNVRPEVCNGQDDDCDGLTDTADPDLQPVLCDEQRGVCSGAMKPLSLCVGGQWQACGAAQYTAHAFDYATSEHKCDGRDEDCDGATDDDFTVVTANGVTITGAGKACGVGGCAGGTTVCSGDSGIVCSSASSALPEVCDGEDNDCDGRLDAADDSLQRRTCDNQNGVCNGALALPSRCVNGQWGACGEADYEAHDTTYEADGEVKCNDKDDDCDGSVDEDFTLELPNGSDVTGVGKNCGAGACSGGVTACLADQTGTWCDSSIVTAQEVCDGVDNDCDGLTDADDPKMTKILCARQAGVCAGAMRPASACVAGQWQLCSDAVFEAHDPRFDGSVELQCDAVDNDCDGATDEDFALVTRDDVTLNGTGKACGTGACAGGVTACNAAKNGITCPGEVRASAEICDNIDNDCDADTDALDTNLVLASCEDQDGVCNGSKHAATQCQGGAWQACTATEYRARDIDYSVGSETRCDGKDNDCDTATDEDFSFTGLDGTVVQGANKGCGVGACGGGQTVCDATGAGLVCNSETLASQEECNGADDDCDGKIDAADVSLLRVACDKQDGVCNGTIRPVTACVGGAWQPCEASVYGTASPFYQDGSETSCDARDNDCDGRTDDDFVYHQKNNVDVSGVGTSCGVGACAGGVLACAPSGTAVVCPTEALASSEICDSADNDCDGFADANDPSLVTVPCEKQAGACAGSTKPKSLCVAGAWQACPLEVYRDASPTYEDSKEVSCDGIDNDCDSGTDEDFSLTLRDQRIVNGINQSCGVGVCAGGTTRCTTNRATIECSTESLATGETCNAKDDDCDGLTDADDASIARVPCEDQDGVCNGSLKRPQRCVAGSWQACGTGDYLAFTSLYDGATELHCDGKDNDCDNGSDEDFPWVDPGGQSFVVGQTCGKGACVGGVVQCTGQGSAACTTAVLARPEACENTDEDCDGTPDDGCDDDGDDYCDRSMLTQQVPLPAVCPKGIGDCNDVAASINPGAAELCDGIDQDCDNSTDEQWTDCQRGDCVASGTGYVTNPPDLCVAGECVPATAQSCGQYACIGGGAEGTVCATGCGSDAECAASAHCDETDGRCKPDFPDGTACVQGSDCAGGRCANGFCCASGDCCSVAANCPASYAQASTCGTPSQCQGTRRDKTCVASICGTSSPIADDRGCTSETLALDCPAGVPDKFCSGTDPQLAPSCPGTCASDAECAANFHCDGTCVPDVVDGGACDETSDCVSDHCNNGFCCTGSGVCCGAPANCPGTFSVAPVCDAIGTCQGHRVDATCVSSVCGSSSSVADDSGCGLGAEANTCGFYDSRFCSAQTDQSTPTCPTSCTADDQCDDNAHCDGTCVGDVVDGGVCDEASDCASGYCNNGFCCSGGTCCNQPIDCPAGFSAPPICDVTSTCQGTRDVATCVASKCGTQLDVADDSACTPAVTSKDCGPYPSVACLGGADQSSPACATSCGSDAQCDTNAYCRNGVCVPDEPDGRTCQDNAECVSGHCQNGFCCASGDCCFSATNCPDALYAEAPTCTSTSTCQGARKDKQCVASICQKGPSIPDDRGCQAGLEANLCGFYSSVFCNGAADQTAPVCGTSCTSDAQCDPGTFCLNGTCKPDATAGQTCGSTAECANGLQCVDGVCCTSSCNGACRRCDLSGNGTCTFAAADTDPDNECAGFACTGYHFGFVNDVCRYKDDVSDAESTCNGAGACNTRDFECNQETTAGPPSPITCDAVCQDPVAGSCTGTVPGACQNLNLGTVSCGDGICARSVSRCIAGHENVCEPGSPLPEKCNELDDDCDRLTDAADPSLVADDPQLCPLQAGVCQGASKTPDLCIEGSWEPCADDTYEAHHPAYESSVETVCDALDNDCSGQTDEDFTMVTLNGELKQGLNKTCGVGRCGGGVTQCRTDHTGIQCSTEGTAQPEICNGIDDDCDGPTDTADSNLVHELCENQNGVCNGSTKPDALCNGASGWNICTTANYQAYSSFYQQGPNEQTCDAKDNDCNGQTDEDFTYTPPVGSPLKGINLSCGVGACAGGVTVCKADGTGTRCSTDGNIATEVCDGIDNDCDGLTDTADPTLVIPNCENQSGVCNGSKKPLSLCGGVSGWGICGPSHYALAAQPGGAFYSSPAEIKCDAKDNDCNGQTDEDFPYAQLTGAVVTGINQSCGVGACANGTTRCRADQNGIECPTEGNASQELCDLVDNDCDGSLDSADSTLQAHGCSNQTGVCNGSTNDASDCQGGAWVACDAADYNRRAQSQFGTTYQTPTETTCDGKDNDCGGGTDEDFTVAGAKVGSVYTGIGAACGFGACAGGTTVCNAAGTGIRCPTEANITAETCDNVDNDCDDLKDGSDITVFPLCGNQTGVCSGSTQRQTADCVNGSWGACTNSDYSFQAFFEASEVSCDNRDNDCDGVTETNEATFSLNSPNCENQLGICLNSKKPANLCVNGSWGTCTNASYTSNNASFSTTDLPDLSSVDVNCDGIDGTETQSIFVAIDGSDSSPGTKAAPKRTVLAGVNAASASKPHVLVSEGTYQEQVTLRDSINVYGGYSRNNSWARSSSFEAKILFGIASGSPASVIAMFGSNLNSSGTKLSRLTIEAQATSAVGTSVYGLYCTACTKLVVEACNIIAGSAGSGFTGGNGGTGGGGFNGGGGGVSNCDSNGTGLPGGGGGGSSCGRVGGAGGKGGNDGSNRGDDGQWGTFNAPPGAGGGGGDPGRRGGDGTAGAAGGSGTDGAGAGGGTFDTVYFPSTGFTGGFGGDGNGGGGGGGGGGQGCTFCDDGRGNGGGGGGGGGCGGSPASGGGGGGSSVGVYLVNSGGAQILSSTLRSGRGGAGGAGGTGGSGGSPGSGAAGGQACTGEVGGGGTGGNGGAGGRGGHGGGGSGGYSFSLYRYNTTVLLTGTTFATDQGGAGGGGPGNSGSAGSAAGNAGFP